MTKCFKPLLAFLIAAAVFALPVTASARGGDRPNAGVCKSGKQVGNIRNCKENGGSQ